MEHSVSIKELPKVELHIHLEAGVRPSTLKILADKHGFEIPKEISGTDQYKWKDFGDFIRIYGVISGMLSTPEIIADATYEYLKESVENGVIYVELTVSPTHSAAIKMTYKDTIDSVAKGIDQAKKEFDVDARMIIVLVRHEGVEACEKIVDDIISYPHPYVVGIGLAGDEIKWPPELFTNAYSKAKNHNLHLTAHAGEFANPHDISNAITLLHAERLGHARLAFTDPKLVDLIKKNNIHIEVCLTSNVFTDRDHKFEPHYETLHKQGISYSLGTDDPAFFNCDMTTEYQLARDRLQLSDADLLQITVNGIQASFADQDTKNSLLHKVKTFASKYNIL